MRIEYFVHGRGRGHASRSVPIVRRLSEAGHEVRVHGGGDGAALLGSLPGWVARAPLRPGVSAVPRLLVRAARDLASLRHSRPDLVIGDGDQSPLLAARVARLPTLAVGHDLVFTSCVLPAELHRLAIWAQRANAAVPACAAVRQVAVHFLPVEPRRAHTVVARPDSPRLPSVEVGDDGFILAYFRDANGSHVVESLRRAGQPVHWYGPGASDESGTVESTLPREQFLTELARCSAVAGSAGSNLLAECVVLGKPVLALYSRWDTEQAMNATWAEAAGVAVAARLDRLDRGSTERFVSRVCARDFATVPLAEQLPQVSDVVLQLVAQ